MVKHKHSKDKLYIVASEYSRDWGGWKKKNLNLPFKSLPFYCCALSLSPFETPLCTDEGIIFDCKNIIPYIKKYHRNPVTGQELKISDLTALKFSKNSENKYFCPITFKVFNDHSHIVANKKSGNVYANEAIENLCRKAKDWKDLITGEPFTSKDLITIQDPKNVTQRQIYNFFYLKDDFNKIPSKSEDLEVPTINKSALMQKILDQSKTIYLKIQEHNKLFPKNEVKEDVSDEKPKHHLYTTHRLASSFTSTAVDIQCKAEFRNLTESEIREIYYKRVKKNNSKGYVQLLTKDGVLNLELHCDLTPVTCDNFLKHCRSGYFNNTIFHRCIANFMIQGGDPSGSGNGGDSAFYLESKSNGKYFKDEFHPSLIHHGIGIISMANEGRKNTNRSQFFITFKSCEHLNNKHTVFGRVVGGLQILKSWEKLKVDGLDKPKDPPLIIETTIYVDPFAVAQEEVENERLKEGSKEISKADTTSWLASNTSQDEVEKNIRSNNEVGKYLKCKGQLNGKVGHDSNLNIAAETDKVLVGDKSNLDTSVFRVAKRKKFDFSSW